MYVRFVYMYVSDVILFMHVMSCVYVVYVRYVCMSLCVWYSYMLCMYALRVGCVCYVCYVFMYVCRFCAYVRIYFLRAGYVCMYGMYV